MKKRSFWPLKVRLDFKCSSCGYIVSTYNLFCFYVAMLKKPVVTEVRTPTDTWSGLGFSKSMPAEGMKELRRANHVPYKPSMSTTYEVNKHKLQYMQPDFRSV